LAFFFLAIKEIKKTLAGIKSGAGSYTARAKPV